MGESLCRSKCLKISQIKFKFIIIINFTFLLLSERKKSKKLFILICTLVIYIHKWLKNLLCTTKLTKFSIIANNLLLEFFSLNFAHMMIVMHKNDFSKNICCLRDSAVVYDDGLSAKKYLIHFLKILINNLNDNSSYLLT